jgi:hypothetical protein
MSRKQAQEIEQLKMALDTERAQRQAWQDSSERARHTVELTRVSNEALQKELAGRAAERDAANAKVAELEKMLAVEQNRRRTEREDSDLKLQLLGWSGCDAGRARKAYHWVRGDENMDAATNLNVKSVPLPVLESVLNRIRNEQPRARLSVAAALQRVFLDAEQRAR